MSGNSLVPVIASRRRAMFFSRSATRRLDLVLDQARFKRRGRAAAFRSPETAPRLLRKAAASDLRSARSGRRSRLREFDSSSRTSCVLRAMRARIDPAIDRRRERQHRDGVRAADAGREHATVERSMFTYGSAPRHHAPRVSPRPDRTAPSRRPGSTTCPQLPNCRGISHREELIGVRPRGGNRSCGVPRSSAHSEKLPVRARYAKHRASQARKPTPALRAALVDHAAAHPRQRKGREKTRPGQVLSQVPRNLRRQAPSTAADRRSRSPRYARAD